ncbi:MAG TPA: hypothetical protein VMT28_06935 [Terriglobales bacterium]|jgi:hypothetical protein|nr:hypothetical protein [Terriglobales bacterium]
MAAIPQQGTYLGTTLVGFTSLAAGLVIREGHFAIGVLGAIVGLGLLIYSGIGLYRIKSLALTK